MFKQRLWLCLLSCWLLHSGTFAEEAEQANPTSNTQQPSVPASDTPEVIFPSHITQKSQSTDQSNNYHDTNQICKADSQITVWVLGGVTKQGNMLCLNSSDPVFRQGPAFMTRVLSQAQGFSEQGLFDKVFVYQLGQYRFDVPVTEHTAPTRNLPVFYSNPKAKRRLFDFQAMEFQKGGVFRSRNQGIDTTPGKEYVVFVKTSANNYWVDLVAKAIGLGTNFATVATGVLLAK